MARYLFIARYARDGIKGIVSASGTMRRTAIEMMVASVGLICLVAQIAEEFGIEMALKVVPTIDPIKIPTSRQ